MNWRGKEGKGASGGSDLDGTKYIRKYQWFKAAELRLSGVYCEHLDELSS
jgi:hypothetical protein